jgi:hypothetical protein
VFVGKPVKLKSAGQMIPVRLQGHKTHIAIIEQVSGGRSGEPLPDLCASTNDIEWDADHNWVMARVHNTGIADADFIDVVLYEGTPEKGKEIGRAMLSHLPWPKDLVAMTHKLGWSLKVPPEGITLTAVIDPDDKIEELIETNNRVTVHLTADAAKDLGAPGHPKSASRQSSPQGESSGRGSSRSVR